MTFTINNETITAKEFTFNALCDLEDMGIDFSNAIVHKPRIAMRAYLAYCKGISLDESGKMIEKHIINGGDLTEMNKAILENLEKSDFFNALIAKAKAEAAIQPEETAAK